MSVRGLPLLLDALEAKTQVAGVTSIDQLLEPKWLRNMRKDYSLVNQLGNGLVS